MKPTKKQERINLAIVIGFGVIFLGLLIYDSSKNSGDSSNAMDVIFGMVLVAGGLLLYFLPYMLSTHRDDRTSIFLVNLFFGWSIIGWVISLAWALKKQHLPVVQQIQQTNHPEDRIYRLHQLYKDGVISEDEFNQRKEMILSESLQGT